MSLKRLALTIKKLSPSNKRMLYYTALIAVAIFGYQYMVKDMTNQSPIAWVLKSNITLNLILLVFGWGVVSDNLAKDKKWGKTKSWVVFLIGLFVIMVTLRLAGMSTIFG
jgi:hypothetical protein